MVWKKKEYWTVVILLATTAFYGQSIRSSSIREKRTVPLEQIPRQIDDWIGEDFFLDAQTSDVLKADQTLLRLYKNKNGDQIWLFLGYFASQKYGSQIHSPKHCLPGSGWKFDEKQTVQLQLNSSDGDGISVNSYKISNMFEKNQLIYWFLTRSGLISDEYLLKLDLIKNALLKKPTDALFVRFNFPLSEERNSLYINLIKQIYPSLKDLL